MYSKKRRLIALITSLVLLVSSVGIGSFVYAEEFEPINPTNYTLSTSTYTYNGKAKTPIVTVLDADGSKIDKSRYTLIYKNNVKPGMASVTVTYLNNAAEKKTINYKILPSSSGKPKLTQKKKNQFTLTVKEDKTVSGYEIRYGTSKSFKKSKTKTSTLANYKGLIKTFKSLRSGSTYYVSVRKYKTVGKARYYGKWSSTAKIKISSAKPHAKLSDEMLDSYLMESMRYVGYKVDKQAAAGSLLQDYASGPRTPTKYRSGISYGGGPDGREYVKSKKTVSGKAPNIKKFRQQGLVCASFVSYYYLNYLPNVAGVDTKFIDNAIKKSGYKSRTCDAWGWAAEYLVKKGKATVVDSVKRGQSLPAADTSKLQIGDLITFRIPNEGLEWGHVAVYAGTNNEGYHFVAHVGSDEGPVFQTLERFENIVNDHDGCAYKKVYRFKGVTQSKYDYSVKSPKKSYKYTGKAITVKPIVKDATGKTISSKYYTVYHKNNVKRGTAKIYVVFKGKYSGVKTATFKIK